MRRVFFFFFFKNVLDGDVFFFATIGVKNWDKSAGTPVCPIPLILFLTLNHYCKSMKKYITLAALLAAGTACANAAAYQTPTDESIGSAWLTTTFGSANQSESTNVSLVNTWTEGLVMSPVSASITAGTNLKTTGVAGESASFLSPDANVGSGTSWTETFSYALGDNVISLSTITLDVGLYDSSGAWQSSQMNNGVLSEGANYRAFDFDATVTIGGQAYVYSVDRVVLTGNGKQSVASVVLTTTEAIENLTGDFTLKLDVAKNSDNGNAGCFVGLTSIAFNSTAPVPEPSAFGMLAGLGALALVASRRRRK